MLRAVLTVVSADAETVVASISPEAGRELPRTHAVVEEENGNAVVKITASDTSAMRAALNSYLECIRITEDIAKITR